MRRVVIRDMARSMHRDDVGRFIVAVVSIGMVKDPALYNSLTQTSSELQKLMYDFRQNPKKYLTINFRLF